MFQLAIVLLAVSAPVAGQDAKEKKPVAPAARVTVTAELACMHCTFGEGNECAVCLKLDDKTPVLLAGKAAKQFEEDRLSKKLVVVEGTLALNKDKRLVLTSDSARVHGDQDKGKAPEKGRASVAGNFCCAKCNLNLCDECTIAVKNGDHAIVLDGKLAMDHAAEDKDPQPGTALGRLFVDKRGLIRLEATKVDIQKK